MAPSAAQRARGRGAPAPPPALAAALLLALLPAAARAAGANCCVNYGTGAPSGVTCSLGCSVAGIDVQLAIDNASPGAVVWLNAGDYKAGVVISKPLTLVRGGGGRAAAYGIAGPAERAAWRSQCRARARRQPVRIGPRSHQLLAVCVRRSPQP